MGNADWRDAGQIQFQIQFEICCSSVIMSPFELDKDVP
jgi:hypothetical protein